MSAVCCYFEVHQPFAVKSFSYLDKIKNLQYFNSENDNLNIQRIAKTSYIPTCQLLLKLIKKYNFHFALSFSGCILELLQIYAPEVLVLFQKLIKTGCVEVLAENYYHSLAVLFDEEEYVTQLKLHRDKIEQIFHVTPEILCNTDLLYSDRLGLLAAKLGYKGILTGLGQAQLGWRSPNYLYQARANNIALFAKNYQLSDDLAFRFSKHDWSEFPLTADKFASWIHQSDGDIVNLFFDFETFGEYHWKSSGIFEFLKFFPAKVLADTTWGFVTPSEALKCCQGVAELVSPMITSWGTKNVSAWLSGSLQSNALCSLYGLANNLRQYNSSEFLEAWRKLQVVNNFYYMLPDDENNGLSPYNNQSDAYINFMNITRDLELKLNSYC